MAIGALAMNVAGASTANGAANGAAIRGAAGAIIPGFAAVNAKRVARTS